ncbi:MAG: serine/threonine-protein kinase [bacterium]
MLDFVGSGNFGHVYKIKKGEDEEILALKTLPTPFSDQDTFKTFKNEGSLATKVSHKNVIKYYYFHDGSVHDHLPPYIIMEYADDGTLEDIIAERLRAQEFFSNQQLKSFFRQLIDGMEAVNQYLVHRDVKPDNILISDNVFKITDFGLSKIVEASTRKSTLKGFGCIQYWPPEAWKFEKNTVQMDIYSMGFVFYELATLKHPLEVTGNDIQEWRDAHFYQKVKEVDAINPNISPILSQIIMGMIQKNIRDRFQNWNQIRELLLKEDSTPTANTGIVDELLRKRLQKDSEIDEEKLKREKRKKEIEEFNKIIHYQLRTEIIEPLQDFVEEFNSKYQGRKIHLHVPDFDFRFSMLLPSGDNIELRIKPILEEDFYRARVVDDYGRKIKLTQLELPQYDNKRIMAWGYLKSSDGRGLNLILVEQEDQLYGSWYMLINKNSAISSHPKRPEPFPFEFDELEKEIKLIKAMHIDQTHDRVLDIYCLKKFIGECI